MKYYFVNCQSCILLLIYRMLHTRRLEIFCQEKSTAQRTNYCWLSSREGQFGREANERDWRWKMAEIWDRFWGHGRSWGDHLNWQNFQNILFAQLDVLGLGGNDSPIFPISSSFAVSVSTDDLHVLFLYPIPPKKRERKRWSREALVIYLILKRGFIIRCLNKNCIKDEVNRIKYEVFI